MRVVTLYTQGILDRRQCLQAGFSPEQRIFLRRQAMQASGRRFRSLPALVLSSLHDGVGSDLSSLALADRSTLPTLPVDDRPNSSATESSSEFASGESLSLGLSVLRLAWRSETSLPGPPGTPPKARGETSCIEGSWVSEPGGAVPWCGEKCSTPGSSNLPSPSDGTMEPGSLSSGYEKEKSPNWWASIMSWSGEGPPSASSGELSLKAWGGIAAAAAAAGDRRRSGSAASACDSRPTGSRRPRSMSSCPAGGMVPQ